MIAFKSIEELPLPFQKAFIGTILPKISTIEDGQIIKIVQRRDGFYQITAVRNQDMECYILRRTG